jgi:hypothetical protein
LQTSLFAGIPTSHQTHLSKLQSSLKTCFPIRKTNLSHDPTSSDPNNSPDPTSPPPTKEKLHGLLDEDDSDETPLSTTPPKTTALGPQKLTRIHDAFAETAWYFLWSRVSSEQGYTEHAMMTAFRWKKSCMRKTFLKALDVEVQTDDVSFFSIFSTKSFTCILFLITNDAIMCIYVL